MDREWYDYDPYPLEPGYRLQLKDNYSITDDATCGNGGSRNWRLLDREGTVVKSGDTCVCGRGCFNHDTIADDWGCHDTDIEEYRA